MGELAPKLPTIGLMMEESGRLTDWAAMGTKTFG